MKHKHLTLVLVVLMSLVSNVVSAHDFAVGGIYYNITSSTAPLTVSVSYRGSKYDSYSNEYSGNVNIPETVTYGSKTYSVTSIGAYAFLDCTRLTSVTIPNSVTSISSYAFDGCSGLTSITIPDSVTSIGERAFAFCTGLTSVTIHNSVTSIGDKAFYNCSGLTSATIGNSVTSIGSNTFSSCSSLTSVTINSNTIASKSYSSSSTLAGIFGSQVTNYVFGDNVQRIGAYACYNCKSLTSVTIPNSVTTIGNYAFVGCSGLTSVTIPNSVTQIGRNAFRECSGLTKAEFASVESLCKISLYDYYANPLYYAHHLYINGEEVTNLVIPNSVTSIGGGAFYNCSGLTSVTIPNSVTNIGDYAFFGCSSLTNVIFLSQNAPSIWPMAFPKSNNIYIYAFNIESYEIMLKEYNNVTILPPASVEVEYCGSIPTLDFTCPDGFNIVSYDASNVGKDVGEYIIPANYTSEEYGDFQDYAGVVINKKALSITPYDIKREYGENNPTLSVKYDGFVAGEDESVLMKQPVINTLCNATSPVGQYKITVSGAEAQNYEINYGEGVIEVTPAPLLISVNNATRAYGDSNPVFSSTYGGLKNGESQPAWKETPAYKTTATATSDVGTYQITLEGGVAKNYEIISNTAGELTITPAPLSIVVNNLSKVYGDTNPDFSCQYSGLKNGETSPTWNTAPTYNTPATILSDVGTYPISLEGGVAKNYEIKSNTDGVLTVVPAKLTITANDESRLYGEDNPIFSFVYSGFKNNDNENVFESKPSASAPDRKTNVGTYKIQPTGASAKNYEMKYVDGTLTIGKAPLVAEVEDGERMYGKTNPTFKAKYTGFVNDENESVISTKPNISTSATRYSDVGTYDIVATGGSAKNYYFSEYKKGTLTIVPAPLTVCANNKTRLYYEDNPELTYTCSGFMNSDNNSVFTTQPVLGCSATMLSDAGTYPISIGGGECKNYTLSYEDALLTIRKRTLEITPDNAQRKYGEENPEFTYSLQGFVSNQNKSVIDEMPEIYTNATKTSDVGTYEICSRGGEAKNYDFNYGKKGTLTINKADQAIIWEQDLSNIKLGDQVELKAYATSGLEIEYLIDANGISIYKVGAKRYLDCYTEGSFSIRAAQSGNKNYEAALRVLKNIVVGNETAIGDITADESDCKVYDIKGNRLSKPQRGINIIRLKDGTTKKVLIK